MNAKGWVLGAAAGTGALVAFAGLPAGIALAAGGANVLCSGAGGGGGIASGPGNGGDPAGSSLTLNASTVAHNSATEGGGMPARAGIANGGLAVIRSSLITGVGRPVRSKPGLPTINPAEPSGRPTLQTAPTKPRCARAKS